MDETESYHQYWGKASPDDQQTASHHLLAYHSLDVAAMGQALLAPERKLCQDIAEFLSIPPHQLQSLFTFALALHDLGKFATAFQRLNPDLPLNIDQSNRRVKTYDGANYRHDRLGLYFLDQCQLSFIPEFSSGKEEDQFWDGLLTIMHTTVGHHGKPVDPVVDDGKRYVSQQDVRAASKFIEDTHGLLTPALPVQLIASEQWQQRLQQVSWQLAGLAVLADWLGSSTRFFPYNAEPMPLSDYWPEAKKGASQALSDTQMTQGLQARPYQSIQNYYNFSPTPLQQWAEQVPVDDSPQLFILEDVTGSGKTEAALALTHRLMEAGAADGFYFGLPTMATSNAMFDRVAGHYQQMLAGEDKAPSIVLAHGAREMHDTYQEAVLLSEQADNRYHTDDHSISAQCNRWLADSRKKALLAPVGVGTIDQALMAVLPRRHQSLRLLGLHRKVLIFDEVHAADDYMFELLDGLLRLHLSQGGSVILLTATLALQQRQRLVSIWREAALQSPALLQKQDFPLATRVTIDSDQPEEEPLASRPSVSREVLVGFILQQEQVVETVVNTARQGRCVVWVRNSVNDAIEAYRQIQNQLDNPEDCLLFHSRFTLNDRKVIENRVLDWLDKNSSAKTRAGKIVIATQVFQESLDADADLMISDICPIDDLIQRSGRLHRHVRDKEGSPVEQGDDQRDKPMLYIHAPKWSDTPDKDWLMREFRDTQMVYGSPGRLWLGLRKLRELGAIKMPADARTLIESVYSEQAKDEIPEAFEEKELNKNGEERRDANLAKSVKLEWQYGYHIKSGLWAEEGDELNIGTRFSDIETVQVLLLSRNKAGKLCCYAGEKKFAVALSTIKVPKSKADKLAPIPGTLEAELDQLNQKYRAIRYLQCWLPDTDRNFTYCTTTGFCERQKQEVL